MSYQKPQKGIALTKTVALSSAFGEENACKSIEDRLLTEKQAAEFSGLSCAWFQRARWAGNGPAFVKLARSVRYRESVLRDWFDARTRTSTSEV